MAPALLWAAACAFGQNAQDGPAFEVATIKQAPPLTPELLGSGKVHPGVRIDRAYADFGGLSLTSLIAYAYRVKSYQVSGPDWMEGARFDVLAKLPDGVSKGGVPEMLQRLLAERFHLKPHMESRDIPVYALVIGKGGSKLSPKPVDYQPDYAVKYSAGKSSAAWLDELLPTTMEEYARTLSYAVDRPVVDQTGLRGEYMLPVFAAQCAVLDRSADVHMGRRAAGEGQGAPADASSPLTPDSSVTKALVGGLKLEPRKLPMKMIVVDHVDMAPTAN